MKLVKFMCTVNVLRAKANNEVEEVKAHPIWINPDDVQMVVPQQKDSPESVAICFRGSNKFTSVEGTFEEVVEKLTTA